MGGMESLQEIQIRIEALRRRMEDPVRPSAPIAETGGDALRRARAMRARHSTHTDGSSSALEFDERASFEGGQVVGLQP